MIRNDVVHAVHKSAIRSLGTRELTEFGLPDGVKAVDWWREDPYGAVLFHADSGAGLHSSDQACLHLQEGHRRRLWGWTATGSGAIGIEDPPQRPDGDGPRIVKLGDRQDRNVRLAFGHAEPPITSIRLSNEQGAWTHPVGVDGFFLLGVTAQDPPTRAVGMTADGVEVEGPIQI
jgi:hypothetical protein